MKPQPLTDEQFQQIQKLNAQHPNPWTRGAWYPAEFNGKAVKIQRTRSAGRPYLKIKREITVNTKTPEGEVIATNKAYEYYTVSLTAKTMTYQGW